MFTQNDILLGVAAPLVVAFALAWALRGSWVGGGGGAAVAGALLVGFVGRIAWPSFRPADSLGWLWIIAVAALIVAMAQSHRRVPAWLGVVLAVALAIVTSWLLLRRLIPHRLDAREATLWIAGLSLAIVTMWAITRYLATRISDATFPLAMFFVASALAACLMVSGSQKLGQLGGALAMGTLGVWLVSLWRGRQRTLAPGGTIVFVVLLAALLIYGRFYASLSPLPAILLVIWPVVMLPIEWWQPRRWHRTIRLIAVLLPLLAAVAMAYAEHMRKAQNSLYGY